jgi:hypothetical protein
MFEENSIFNKYIAINDKDSEFRIKVAYLLESFMLGNYEIIGGQLPQIFIRVNDPYRINLLAKYKEHTNLILQDIDKRQKNSVATMEKFFTSKLSDNERWNFIEDYFLGKEI